MKKKKTEHIEVLKKSLMRYSMLMDTNSYNEKTPLQKEIVDLIAVLNFKLEKLEYSSEEKVRQQTPQEELMSQLCRTITGLSTGEVPLSNDTCGEFKSALKLLEKANLAKIKGKSLLAQDALKSLGD